MDFLRISDLLIRMFKLNPDPDSDPSEHLGLVGHETSRNGRIRARDPANNTIFIPGIIHVNKSIYTFLWKSCRIRFIFRAGSCVMVLKKCSRGSFY